MEMKRQPASKIIRRRQFRGIWFAWDDMSYRIIL